MTSSFTSPLVVSPMPDGRRWKLVFPFRYHVGTRYSKEYVAVPAGFETDFASIPKFLWWLPYWAKYCKPPVLHDWLYTVKEIMGRPITRKRADEIFYEGLLIDWRYHKSGHILAATEYWVVRLFGWLAWQRILWRRLR